MGVIIRQSLKGTFVNYVGVLLGIFVQFYIVAKYLDPEVIGLSKAKVVCILCERVNLLTRYGVGNGFVLIMGRCVMVGHTEDVVGAEAFQSTALESCKGLRTRHLVCVKAIDV